MKPEYFKAQPLPGLAAKKKGAQIARPHWSFFA
jgi:hypothetical protein